MALFRGLQLLTASQWQPQQGLRLQMQQHILPLAYGAAATLSPHQQQQQRPWQWQQGTMQQLQCCQVSTSAAAEAPDSSAQQQATTIIRYPTKHEKRVAHLRFCQQRAAWRRQMKQLRMQWLEEFRAQRAAQRADAEEVKQQIAQLRQLRDADKQHDRERHQLEKMLQDAERAVDTAERRLQSAQREEWRQQTLQKYRQRWRKDLEKQSRSWIAPEDLEARVAAALDNPRPL